MSETSPFLAWDPSYAVGIEVVDEQHEKLFEIMDRLYDQVRDDGPRTVSAATAGELLDYCRYHFTTEEAIYRQGAWPLLHKHEMLHMDFILWIAEMQVAVSHTGYSAFAALGHLREWWLDHIQQEDRAAAEQVIAAQVGSAAQADTGSGA